MNDLVKIMAPAFLSIAGSLKVISGGVTKMALDTVKHKPQVPSDIQQGSDRWHCRSASQKMTASTTTEFRSTTKSPRKSETVPAHYHCKHDDCVFSFLNGNVTVIIQIYHSQFQFPPKMSTA
jgi:hypothetical protein